MGFITQTAGSARFADVVNGQLRVREGNDYQFYPGFSGRITGVRTRENTFQNQRTVRVEIRMESEDAGTVIISGTLYNADGTVSTWGKMLASRIGNPANADIRDRDVDLVVYPMEGNDKVSCCSLHMAGKSAHLPRVVLPPKSETDKLRAAVEDCLDYAQGLLGTFGPSFTDDDGDHPAAPAPPTATATARPVVVENVLDDGLPF